VSRTFHWGKTERAKIEKIEAELPKAESGMGLFGRGSKHPPVQLWSLGERCELPHGVCCETQTAQRFSTIFSTQDVLS